MFEGLRAASVGDLSTRYANAMRRKLLESIRHDLSEKYRAKGDWYVLLVVVQVHVHTCVNMCFVILFFVFLERCSFQIPAHFVHHSHIQSIFITLFIVVNITLYSTTGSHLGVVPEHEVQKVLHRRVLEQFTVRQRMLNMKYTYNGLKRNVSCCEKFYNIFVVQLFFKVIRTFMTEEANKRI